MNPKKTKAMMHHPGLGPAATAKDQPPEDLRSTSVKLLISQHSWLRASGKGSEIIRSAIAAYMKEHAQWILMAGVESGDLLVLEDEKFPIRILSFETVPANNPSKSIKILNLAHALNNGDKIFRGFKTSKIQILRNGIL